MDNSCLIFKKSKDGSAIVDPNYFWIEKSIITPESGNKVQLINRSAGCATYGFWSNKDDYWTHWAPLPKFRVDPMGLFNPESHYKHPAVKADIAVNSGALNLALNSLRRGTTIQREIADALEATVENLK